MASNELDDAGFAARIESDRTTVSRLRRGKLRPGWRLAERIRDATEGAVTPNDFLAPAPAAPAPRRKSRAA